MRKLGLLLLTFSATLCIQAVTPLWLRQAAISPDGSTIAFAYKGDIYTVPASGGQARQLTSNRAFDGLPCWSLDGKKIAFQSDREGSRDVWMMSAQGEGLTRLTTHSGTEIPMGWLSADEVLFSTAGWPRPESIQFPDATFPQLYKVLAKEGQRPYRVADIAAGNVCVGAGGVLYFDMIKGYEDTWRKHMTSSVARDIWQWTPGKKGDHVGTFHQLTNSRCDDRNPVCVGQTIYWLSQQDGTFNVWSVPANGGSPKQLTTFKDDPVRYLTASTNGTLCFSQNGELYTMRQGQKPVKLNINVVGDIDEREVQKWLTTSGVSAISHSPKGKEIAFIMNGDVYVTSLDYKTTRQITSTPEREREVSFGEDGRSVIYDSERDGTWSIYQTTIVSKDEKQFIYSTELKEERLTDGRTTCFQPVVSPDGKKVAFLRNRTELCVIDLKSKSITTVMPGKWEYSYSDGDQSFSWSPNSKWLLSEYIGTGGWNHTDIALIPADGKGKIVNLTNSGYNEGNASWVLDGKAFIFTSDRDGYRSHGSWGAEGDEYICFLEREAYERFSLNKEERELDKQRRDEEKKEKEKKEKEKRETDKKKKPEQLKKDSIEQARKDSIEAMKIDFDLTNLDQRTVRLTTGSSRMGDAVMNKDATKLYYVASYLAGVALWEVDLEKQSTTLKAKGISGGFDLTKDAENAYLIQGGQIKKLKLESGSLSTIDFEAYAIRRPIAYRAYLLEHMWRQMKEKVFDPNMNGANWDAIHDRYKRFLPHINNGYDFGELASEMLGEVNVSHTGCRYRPGTSSLRTADLGILFDDDFEGDGLRIAEVIAGSPLDIKGNVKAGDVITHIDGEPIKAGLDYYPLLEGKQGRYTRLTITGGKDGKRDITIRPNGSTGTLMYERWWRRLENYVDSLSKGRLAYVHIEAMNSPSFRHLYRNLLNDKNRNREAAIIDTRHNGGGSLHNDVLVLLSGHENFKEMPRGQYVGTDPYNRWTKPSCMLIGEDNYSNAHGTPWVYRENKVGKLIGAPVPGTMTSVWWESIDNYVFGIPMVVRVDANGGELENTQLEPDILIYNDPEDVIRGRDAQLEVAVRTMLNSK
jgi:Tol biopolymer transport system component/C-terminal processing protease CtpA/Prc